jgi:hypothetical protein
VDRSFQSRGGCGGTGFVFEHCHFTENVAGTHLGENVLEIPGYTYRDFDETVFDKVEAVPGVSFLKNLAPGPEALFETKLFKQLHFGWRELAEELARFDCDHGVQCRSSRLKVQSSKLQDYAEVERASAAL